MLPKSSSVESTACIAQLQQTLDASAIVLLDADGHIRDSAGEVAALDLPSIAVLTAGIMAAGRGLKHLFGDENLYQMSLEGAQKILHFQFVLPENIMVVACSSTTPLGLIRLHSRRSAEALNLTSLASAPDAVSLETVRQASA